VELSSSCHCQRHYADWSLGEKKKKAARAFASKLCVLLRRWLSAEEPPGRAPMAVSAIHFIAADLAAVRH
jgi:hypothetical protein